MKRHLHVSFADEVLASVSEPPFQITRRKLQGAELRRRQKIIHKKSLKSGILADEMEHTINKFCPDVFEDIVMELSLDDMGPVENIYSYNTDVIHSDDKLEKRFLSEDLQSIGTGSDSGLGESFTDDMIDVVMDGICEQLLMYCETNSDRLNAVIVAGLIQSNPPELFVNAGLSASHIGAVGLLEFAHGGGDIHTALRVILAWMKEERSQKKPDISKWCSTHGICCNSLKNIMSYINNLQQLGQWDYEPTDDFLVHRYIDDKITTMLTATFGHEVCYYLGHPSLGYKNLRTGQRIVCCPVSSLQLLGELPNFVLSCSVRHKHIGTEEEHCHYLVALDDCVGLQLAADLSASITIADYLSDRVSLVGVGITCGSETCQEIQERWNYSHHECGPTIQKELSSLCDNSFVALDIIENRFVQLFVPERYHVIASEFIQDIIQQIRNKIAESEVLQSLSKTNPAFKMLLTPGIQCGSVHFPRDQLFTDAIKAADNRTSVSGVFNVKTEVTVEVKISASHSALQACPIEDDPTQAVLKILSQVLRFVHFQLWSFHGVQIQKSSIHVQLLFQTHATARRAMILISDENDMEVTDVADVEKQCRSMELLVDPQVFSTVADNLKYNLDRLTRSSKYQLDYEITKRTNHVSIRATTTLSILVNDVIQKIKQLFVPFVFISNNNNRNATDLHGADFKFVLQLIGQRTGAVLILLGNPGKIAIYGSKTMKDEANAYLMKYLCKDFNNTWLPIGIPMCVLDVIPRDFMLCFHNNTKLSSSLDKDDSFFHVDFKKKMIWGQLSEELKDMSQQFLCGNIIHLLQVHYGVEVSEDLFQFDCTQKQNTCVTCYGDATEFYTLEVCQHTYCYECINTQVKTALNENRLPLSCAECDTLLSIADMNNLIKSRQVPDCKRKKVSKAVLARFVAKNHEKYHFCSRPDCGGLFKKCSRWNGGLVCGVCGTEMCENCNEKAHYGMNCQEYMEIGKWMEEDPQNRKRCPKCSMRIMKDGGCNNVRCQHCQMSICWVCLTFDEIPRTIYTHMDASRHWT